MEWKASGKRCHRRDSRARKRLGEDAGEVLFKKLRDMQSDVGGFSWWRRVPPNHGGEEALAQLLLLQAFGGCGVLPSGT